MPYTGSPFPLAAHPRPAKRGSVPRAEGNPAADGSAANGLTRRVSRFFRRARLRQLLALSVLLLSSPALAAPAVSPLRVSASVHPLALLVRAVGGEDVKVDVLLPPGVSPHGFEPTPAQMRRLAEAEWWIAVGGGLDPWAERLAEGVSGGRPHLILIQPSAGSAHNADHNADHEDGHRHSGVDPHLWLDPVLVRDELVPRISAALSRQRPAQAKMFAGRAAAFQQRLTALDAELTAGLAPYKGGAFVAFHGAWGRFAARYGLREVAVVEPSPGREPSARWMAQVVETARREHAVAVIIEPGFNPRVANTIAAQFGGRTVTANPEGGLGGTWGATYEDLMRYNMGAFRAAMTP
ncbi:MAG: metal ABC transporter substrate-binding protein [Nitrospirota bacterium]|nr:metal ABC transporter substrate-binding protein [Nitrospirota bacterium]